ncbi:hypothetical protein GA0115251_105812 [Streptomyces sp. TverLS-915]|nr:hypothetical protein GA0115251_105812 [Streptomyces sp. TverLS-915]
MPGNRALARVPRPRHAHVGDGATRLCRYFTTVIRSAFGGARGVAEEELAVR